jgi:hypothetical protein
MEFQSVFAANWYFPLKLKANTFEFEGEIWIFLKSVKTYVKDLFMPKNNETMPCTLAAAMEQSTDLSWSDQAQKKLSRRVSRYFWQTKYQREMYEQKQPRNFYINSEQYLLLSMKFTERTYSSINKILTNCRRNSWS